MCGIAGSLNFLQPDPPNLVEKMTQQMARRGPDCEKIVQIGPMVMGHRRLSVIDPSSSSNQPLADHSNRFWIVLNGEIYNYLELKTILIKQGAIFKTNGDTEVILEAWKLWGIECLPKLTGMFSFAIWDRELNHLCLVRDRLGEKPLYYATLQQHSLIFASTLQALLAHPEIKNHATINLSAISQYLSLNYILTDSCMINGIKKLEPGYFLSLSLNNNSQINLEIKPYWELKNFFLQPKNNISIQTATEQLSTLLTNSVKQQMVSDVPLGAFLSGGLDSSTIVGIMKDLVDPKLLQTFCLGFTEKSYNEAEKSQLVANNFAVNHNVNYLNTSEYQDLFKIAAAFDEPFADSSMIPSFYLAAFAKNKVTVCLSGDGGDELFAGYETYIASLLHRFFKFIPTKLISSTSYLFDHFIPTSFNKVSIDYKIKKFLAGLQLPFARAHYSWRTIFSDQEKDLILKKDFKNIVTDFDPFEKIAKFFEETKACNWLDQCLYTDMKSWLVDDILVKVDRSCMAHGLESRVPFLDHKLVEFIVNLPTKFKLNIFNKKYLLQLSQKNKLPKTIINQKKRGFNAPIANWLFFDPKFKIITQELIFDTNLEWLEKKYLEQLWQEHFAKIKDHSLKLFGIMMLSIWVNNFKRGLA